MPVGFEVSLGYAAVVTVLPASIERVVLLFRYDHLNPQLFFADRSAGQFVQLNDEFVEFGVVANLLECILLVAVMLVKFHLPSKTLV